MHFCSDRQNGKDQDLWTSPDAPDDEWHNPEWVTNLPDGKYLSDLSIPGTHDMKFATQQVGNDWVWCQCWGMELQMPMGLSFFDRRCQNFSNDLPLHHASYFLNRGFNDVFRIVAKYLDGHFSY